MNTDSESVRARLMLTREAVDRFADKRSEDLAKAAALVVDTYRSGGKVLIFGNGGSAAEAQHIAAELVNRMLKDRDPLPAIALTTDSSIMTSVANDYDYEEIFTKQVKALGRPGDLAWGLSTSGGSKNVIRAMKAAGEIGMKRLGMAGKSGAPIGEVSDLCVWVDADSTPVIQEVHLAAAHIICEIVERELFGEASDG